jgi:hypothetical protein
MPASPPTGYDKHLKSLPILPKPHGELYKEHTAPPPETSPPTSYYHHSPNYTNTTTTTPDQSTLWALFNQFQRQQQQQQQQQQNNTYRPEDHSASNNRRASDPTDRAMLSSEEVLAEKRRRNAGASARFRDRRKQRERELQDKCHELEQRTKEFEMALRRIEPDHPLLVKAAANSSAASLSSSPHHSTTTDYPGMSDQHTLFDRVGQLEHMMTRFRQEKETDVQKLDELEKEVCISLVFYCMHVLLNHLFLEQILAIITGPSQSSHSKNHK